jgi:LDH2 family malate/lactate/ureidoglycolate dehydrogenase
MAQFTQTIHQSPVWDAGREMLLPGELEHRQALVRLQTGIPLPASLYAELTGLGRETAPLCGLCGSA